MSISPREISKDHHEPLIFHMRVSNHGKKKITGKVQMKVFDPSNKLIKTITQQMSIPPQETKNVYKNFSPPKKLLLGKYKVQGLFIWNGRRFFSETSNNDFFRVVK